MDKVGFKDVLNFIRDLHIVNYFAFSMYCTDLDSVSPEYRDGHCFLYKSECDCMMPF